MQLIAKGKWSKQMKRWTKVVALRRPTTVDNNNRRHPTDKHGERPQGR